jgi:hypothetical protein
MSWVDDASVIEAIGAGATRAGCPLVSRDASRLRAVAGGADVRAAVTGDVRERAVWEDTLAVPSIAWRSTSV